jgi:hypothetical protein
VNHQFRFQILTHWASSQNKGQPQVAVVDGATGGKVDLSAALNSIADTRNAEYAAAKANINFFLILQRNLSYKLIDIFDKNKFEY